MNFREKQARGAYGYNSGVAAKGWSMVMFPCRKLHYFIHAVPRRDWRKHCVPSTANFHMQNCRSDVEQSGIARIRRVV